MDIGLAKLTRAFVATTFLDLCIPREGEAKTRLALRMWFQTSTYAQATDPRDFVFALLALTEFAEEVNLIIDYSKSVSEVYRSMVLLELETRGTMSLLASKEMYEMNPELSTWTPDWSRPVHTGRLSLPPDIFDPSHGSQVDLGKSNDSQKLSLKGLQVGHVKTVGSAFGEHPTLIDYLESINSDTLCISHYGTRENIDDAFWRLVIADTVPGQPMFRRWPKNEKSAGIQKLCQEADKVFGSLLSITYLRDRRLVVSSNGQIGLVPEEVMEGDVVCIFAGGPTPFIIRRHPGRDVYQHVGEAYVHGIIDGGEWDEEKLEYFSLV